VASSLFLSRTQSEKGGTLAPDLDPQPASLIRNVGIEQNIFSGDDLSFRGFHPGFRKCRGIGTSFYAHSNQ
jgi:hypothetical protein